MMRGEEFNSPAPEPFGEVRESGTWTTAPSEEASASAEPRSLRNLVLGSKLGKLVLTAILGLGLLWGLGRYAGSRMDPKASGDGTRPDPLGASPPLDGFEETLTTAGELKSLYVNYGSRLKENEEGLGSLREEVRALSKEFQATGKALGEWKESQVERETRLDRILKSFDLVVDPKRAGLPGKERAAEGESSNFSPPGANRLRIRSFPLPPKKTTSVASKTAVIPTAGAAEATLINGCFAPVSGEPSPVRLRLDAAIRGPNRSRVPLRGGLLIGKAVGDANTSRVTIELTALSFTTEEGKTVDLSVRGYVEAADGMEGVPGTYQDRLETHLPLAGAASLLSEGAGALAERETQKQITPLGGVTSAVTGDPLKFAGFRSARGLTSKINDIVAERLRQIRPAVYTKPGQKVTVVFLEPVELGGLSIDEVPHEKGDPYEGLDLHR